MAVSLAFIGYLYIRFPGLSDPTNGPYYYWPEVEVYFAKIVAIASAVIGIPTFWLFYCAYRRRRAEPLAKGPLCGPKREGSILVRTADPTDTEFNQENGLELRHFSPAIFLPSRTDSAKTPTPE